MVDSVQQVARMQQWGLDQNSMVELALGELERAMLSLLRLIPTTGKGKKAVDALKNALACIKVVERACSDDGYLVHGHLREPIRQIVILLSPEHAALDELEAACESTESHRVKFKSDEASGALEEFMATHAVGEHLLTVACAVADSRKHEKEQQSKIDNLSKCSGELQDSAKAGSKPDADLVGKFLGQLCGLVGTKSKDVKLGTAQRAELETIEERTMETIGAQVTSYLHAATVWAIG